MIMNRVYTIAEGLIVAALGLSMYCFSISETYWMLLNPKFQVLTAASGFALAVVGGALAIRKHQGPPLWGAIVVLGGFLALFWWAGFRSETPFASESPSGHVPLSMELPESPDDAEPRMTIGNREYVKISTPELFVLTEEKDADFPPLVVFRGIVARSPELDERGMIAVFRVNVFCCLADAVAPGFLVSVDNPDDYQQGIWVRVAGEVLPSQTENTNGEISLPGMLMSFLNPGHEIKGHSVESTKPPEIPFTFEVRNREPFVY